MNDQLYTVHEAVSGGIRLQVEFQPRANYALVLSGIPFIRAVVVHNETGRELSSIQLKGRLEIAGYPNPVAWARELSGPHTAGSVTRLDRLADFAEFLPVLSEAVESSSGRLDLRARIPDAPGQETRLVADVQVSASNEFLNWPGLHASLATFVQPNTRSVTTILRSASELLMEQTGNGALDGYQSGPDRVAHIGAALYESLRARQVTYINPPASFEKTGQKVRTTEQVLSDRFGTCIDMAVLYAACLEAAGLYPVTFITRDHAFGGYYTQEISGETTTVTEVNSIANLVEIGLITPVELTGMNPGSNVDFRAARAKGTDNLARHLDEVLAMVDVRKARLEAIRPMPQFRSVANPVDDPVEDQAQVDAERPFVIRASLDDAVTGGTVEDVRGLLDAQDDSPTRFRFWKRDLLDLSLRNPLLNMPKTQKVMDLLVPDGMLARLDDVVHTGKSVRLAAVDALDAIQVARGLRAATEVPGDDLRSVFETTRTVYTTAGADLYSRQLRSMKREADTLEQETGSNYLYLTFGALIHPKKGGGEARAPLFLLPVRLTGGLGRTPFSLKLDGQEIAQPNLCLLQWLKTTHGASLPDLENPAIDDAGLAIQTVFTAIRASLVDAKLPYRVDETCAIAILRFSTFQIWKDLDEQWEALIGNPVVRHLVEKPGETFDDPTGGGTPQIDEPALRLPIAADGSQMAAVVRAAAGHSFVLEGPPGTGKSQTITNLIAHALALGKTVLFVAEKQAALEVVQRRLDAIGIGAVALELHGSKQSMKSIRDQLRQALELQVTPDQAAWDAADARLRAAITQLASHPEQVHEANPAGLSLWGAYDAVAASGDGPVGTISARQVAPKAGSTDTFDVAMARDVAQQFQDAAIQVSLRPGHPWLLTGPKDDSPLDTTRLQEAAAELSAVRARLDGLAPVWREHLRWFYPGSGLKALLTLIESAASGLVPPVAEAPAIERRQWRESVDALRASVATFQATHQAVLRDVDAAGLALPNLQALILESARLDEAVFFPGMRRKSIVNQIRPHVRDGAMPDGKAVTTLLRSIAATADDARRIDAEREAIPGLVLANDWQPGTPTASTEIDRAQYVSQLLAWLVSLNPGLVPELAQATDADRLILSDVEEAWARWLDALGSDGEALKLWSPAEGSVRRDWVQAWGEDEPAWRRDLDGSGTLQPQRFRTLAQLGERLTGLGFEPFATEILSGSIPSGDVSGSLLRGLARASLTERLHDGGLESFDADAHDRTAADFLATSKRMRTLQETQLAAAILAHRPFRADQLRGEVAELKRQLDRKRGGLSFRELVRHYPRAITALTPCFLMSPGSVAHFLDADSISFDLVIFDEASQIRVPQAIGAMGRGKAVVVVGDSRQMPPTRVMQVDASANGGSIEFHEELVVEDLESILSEAVESGLPQEWLTWHYRSQDESLIAFSNGQYYGNKLVSLPSPGDNPSTGLSWRRVDGVFDRGRGRTNEIEADAIVDEIVARLHNPATRDDSIGVVCFNIQQRDLILNKLEDSTDPLVQEALTAEPGDALFVKNLENVQGDERDTILFSLAFSLDKATGKLPLNFGPLNLSGGERRLNVAITRARKQIILFSSFDPADIDLARSSARGIHDLRSYMEFAATQAAQAPEAAVASRAARSRLVSELADALRDRGYEVGCGIGLSAFKVDLAVRKPGESRWRLAVMVDGPEWSSRPTVADRDGSPQLLAEIMHWGAVVRVWLPGWLRDRDGTLARIEQAVEAVAPGQDTPMSEAEPAIAPVPGPGPEPSPVAPVHTRVAAADSTGQAAEIGVFNPAPDTVIASQSVLGNMQMADPAIRRYAREILAVEGPTQLDRLVLLIARRFGFRRIGAQKRAEIEEIVRSEATISVEGADFAWPPGVDPATWGEFRRTVNADDRGLQEISPHELANAMVHLLDGALSMTGDDLERETLTLFGYVRMTGAARTWLQAGIDFAIAQGRIKEVDGRYELAKEHV